MQTLHRLPERPDPLLTIVVPCFQEEQTIPEFHQRITRVVRDLSVSCEILYIDDGSNDRTADLLRHYQDGSAVRCLFLSRNFGKEAAMSAGIDHARGSALIFIDVDLQDPPELISTMVDYWQRGYDVVNMQRSLRTGDSWLKRMSARGYYWIMQRLVDMVDLPTDVSDFRLIGPAPVFALRALDERSRTLKSLIGWVGFRTIELSYNRTARHAGNTKWNAAGLFNLAIESILSFSRKPLRIFSFISFGLFISSICYLLAAFVAGSFDIHHLLVVIASFMCVGVAMVGEYLGVTLTEVKRRPLYFLKRNSKTSPVTLHPPSSSIESKKC
ncbi:glycosyltransferase family 2 protein [Pseudomonas sp. PDM31]|jgi:glycosyltransferase involved in cell wall biosynthesis|uniref:glycosyltransferase family 2 protein n=1 Tax=Pseudomonas sp. PDM31 TaxID=2854778 RepID=UPI001C47C8CF|nr:glycosyltransferase family 2 protein [Pseudomonas sp. PDM31]MBV7479127.1 glycosyltransferase family 2 protein [Pseudomonas sp. PDM31]